MNPILNIASKAAINSSTYMLRCFEQLEKPFLQKKNRYVIDYVEKIAINTIKNAYPYHSVVSQNIKEFNKNSSYTWIISVLNGKNNFINKLPIFGISIAIKYKDRIEHGLFYDPSKNEMFKASRNQGAILNGKRIRVKKKLTIKNSIIGVSINDIFKENGKYNMFRIINDTKHLFDIRCLGSSSINLVYLALGRISGYFQQNIDFYDIAAGSLIAKESGCYVSDYNNEGNFLSLNNIVGAHPEVFPYIIEIIRKNKN